MKPPYIRFEIQVFHLCTSINFLVAKCNRRGWGAIPDLMNAASVMLHDLRSLQPVWEREPKDWNMAPELRKWLKASLKRLHDSTLFRYMFIDMGKSEADLTSAQYEIMRDICKVRSALDLLVRPESAAEGAMNALAWVKANSLPLSKDPFRQNPLRMRWLLTELIRTREAARRLDVKGHSMHQVIHEAGIYLAAAIRNKRKASLHDPNFLNDARREIAKMRKEGKL